MSNHRTRVIESKLLKFKERRVTKMTLRFILVQSHILFCYLHLVLMF